MGGPLVTTGGYGFLKRVPTMILLNGTEVN